MARPVAEDTRSRILDAAEHCFIHSGFAATSMREIATQSNTTNSLIVHHFGTKADLWEQVKHRRMQGFLEKQQAILASPELNIEQFLDATRLYFELLRDDPALVQLLARAELEQDLTCSRFKQELVTGFVERIVAGQQQQIFHSRVKPAYLLAMILSSVTQWMEARHQFTSWEEIAADENPDDAFLETLIDVLLHGVQGANQ